MAFFTVSAALLHLARPSNNEEAPAILQQITQTLTLLRELDPVYAQRLESWVKDTLTLNAQTP